MDPEAFRHFQKRLGLSDRRLAEFLCVDARNLRRWKTGQNDIPAWVEKFLPVLVKIATCEYEYTSVRELKGMVGL